MRLPAGLFLVSAAVILTAWWRLGMPVQMPPAPINPGEKLHCLSYAPFRAGQTPLDESTRIDPKQIEEDLQRRSPHGNGRVSHHRAARRGALLQTAGSNT